MGSIWVLAENQEQTLELMSKGLELARDLGAKLVTFTGNCETANVLIGHGADEVYLLPPLPENEVWGAYVEDISEIARQQPPVVILIAGTMRGREIAARMAHRLNAGLCSGCISMALNPDTGQLEMERFIYGGAAIQTVVCTRNPQMATIPPRTFEPAPYQEGHPGEIIETSFDPCSPVKIKEVRPVPGSAENLGQAKNIVCAGRGVENETDLELVRKLARTVGGQIGCTRPLSEELHWLQDDSCIGLSGQQVRPELYIGVGVSGQIQHTTGIRDSKIIVAINRDENAPIFEMANFGIVGDWYEVVPKLIEELEKKKG